MTLKKKKILIIEDDAGNRFVLEKFLHPFFEVTAKSDGKEALTWMTNNRPDLVITDLNMPNLNGIQFIKNVRASMIHKNIAIMVISGFDDIELKSLCYEYDIVNYFVKPYNPAGVVLKIYELFNLSVNGDEKIERLMEINSESLNSVTSLNRGV